MPRFDGIRRALHIDTRRSLTRAVDDELRFHLDMRIEELVHRGVAPERARRMALDEFGDLAGARDELAVIDRARLARQGRARWWSDLWQDVRFAARVLWRQPGFTVVVLLTLALGVGANTAIFTVVNAALLRPLPYVAPERLVHLWETRAEVGAVHERTEASYPDFVDWRTRSRSLASIEGYDPTNLTVTIDGEPRMLRGGRVTAGFFSMLGVRASIGRLFAAGDDPPGGSPVVVLGHDYWRTRLGGRADVVGTSLLMDGRRYEIVGVLPAGFRFAPIGDAELWLPLDRSAEQRAERFNHWLNVVARLRDGETPESARRDLAAVMRQLAIEHAETNAGRGIEVVPLREQISGDARPILLVLLGAVALVLFIACANVASLLLARTMARRREMAVRSALGAGRARLARLVLVESALLAMVGGVFGALIARAGVGALVAAIPDPVMETMPYLRDVAVDRAMLGYAFALALATGLAFGLAPALYASRASLADVLRQGTRVSTGGARGMRDLLVAGEIALTVVLLVGAGLVGRSLIGLLRVDAGFEAERVLTMRIALSGSAYDSARAQQWFFEQLTGRVRVLPGVLQVGAVTNLPLNGGGTNTFKAEGRAEPGTAARPEAVMRGVAGAYFQAMGIRLVAGRAFSDRDRAGAEQAVVVSEALARRQFSSPAAAVGERLRFYAFPESTWRIIGVVRDVKTARLDEAAPPTVYYSHLQGAENRMSLVVRVAGDPLALVGAIRRELRSLDPSMPVYAVRTMEQQVAESPAVFVRRYPLVLIGAFAVAALVLAIVGLYGVVSYAAAQRMREMGIRVALGARSIDIARLVLRQGAVLAGSGIVVGLVIALALTRLLTTLVYGVSVTDPATYIVVATLLGSVTLLASWLPAQRASQADPMVALRAD